MFQVLVQEVGEGSTVQSLLAASSGWRGRAQQIITLQKKVCSVVPLPRLIIIRQRQSKYSGSTWWITYAVLA